MSTNTNTDNTDATRPDQAALTNEERALFEELADRFGDREEGKLFETIAQSSTEESN